MVVDTSVLVAALSDSQARGQAARYQMRQASRLAVPYGADLETVRALRGLVLRGSLSATEAGLAVDRFQRLRLRRFPHVRLLGRVWELRDTVSTYDAAFVALAEVLDVHLLTADQRLARASGPRCQFVVLS